jgi:hypothetical protein
VAGVGGIASEFDLNLRGDGRPSGTCLSNVEGRGGARFRIFSRTAELRSDDQMRASGPTHKFADRNVRATHQCSGWRIKNFHLSMLAGTATSKKPTIISL